MNPFLLELGLRWQSDLQRIIASAGLVGETLWHTTSPLTLVDLVLTFALLWWLYRRLRKTELIKILPRIIMLLIALLASYILGLWVMFYLLLVLLGVALMATGSLYAPEIRTLLQGKTIDLPAGHRVTPASQQTAIAVIAHAADTLLSARKQALFLIKKGKPLTRLAETGLKLNIPLKAENLLDAYLSRGEASGGAAIIEGNRLTALGASLGKARLQFTPTSAVLKQVAKDFHAVAVIINPSSGGISMLYQGHVHKHLTATDLSRTLESILI